MVKREVMEGYIYVFLDWNESDVGLSKEKIECDKTVCDEDGCHCEGISPFDEDSLILIMRKWHGKKVKITVEEVEE